MPLERAALRQLIPILNDSYASNRMVALGAVERILGRTLSEDEYSLIAPLSVRRRQAEALLQGQLGASRGAQASAAAGRGEPKDELPR